MHPSEKMKEKMTSNQASNLSSGRLFSRQVYFLVHNYIIQSIFLTLLPRLGKYNCSKRLLVMSTYSYPSFSVSMGSFQLMQYTCHRLTGHENSS